MEQKIFNDENDLDNIVREKVRKCDIVLSQESNVTV